MGSMIPSRKPIKCVILAAGYGKRLGKTEEVWKYLPKGLVKVQGHPALSYTLQNLENTEIPEVIIATNRLSEPLYRRYIDSLRTMKDYHLITEKFSTPDEVLGVGETLKVAIDEGEIEGSLLVLPCDNIFAYSLQDLIDSHRKKGGRDVVAVYRLEDIKALSRYAIFELSETNRIVSYENRPKMPLSNFIFILHVILSEDSVKALPDFLSNPHEKEYLRDFIGSRIPYGLYGIDVGEKWIDIGMPKGLREAQKLEWITELSKSLRI